MWKDRTNELSCRSRNVRDPLYRVAYENPDGSFTVSKNIPSLNSSIEGSHCNLLYKTMFGSLAGYERVKRDEHDTTKLFILEKESEGKKEYMVLLVVPHATWQKYSEQWPWFVESSDYNRDIMAILRAYRKKRLRKKDRKSGIQTVLAVGIGAALGGAAATRRGRRNAGSPVHERHEATEGAKDRNVTTANSSAHEAIHEEEAKNKRQQQKTGKRNNIFKTEAFKEELSRAGVLKIGRVNAMKQQEQKQSEQQMKFNDTSTEDSIHLNNQEDEDAESRSRRRSRSRSRSRSGSRSRSRSGIRSRSRSRTDLEEEGEEEARKDFLEEGAMAARQNR